MTRSVLSPLSSPCLAILIHYKQPATFTGHLTPRHDRGPWIRMNEVNLLRRKSFLLLQRVYDYFASEVRVGRCPVRCPRSCGLSPLKAVSVRGESVTPCEH